MIVRGRNFVVINNPRLSCPGALGASSYMLQGYTVRLGPIGHQLCRGFILLRGDVVMLSVPSVFYPQRAQIDIPLPSMPGSVAIIYGSIDGPVLFYATVGRRLSLWVLKPDMAVGALLLVQHDYIDAGIVAAPSVVLRTGGKLYLGRLINHNSTSSLCA
jgi:hypothetical protein